MRRPALSHRRMAIFLLPALLPALLLGCGSPPPSKTQKPAPTQHPTSFASRPCSPKQNTTSPFEHPQAFHILLADFSGYPPPKGPGHNEPNFAFTLARVAKRTYNELREIFQKIPDIKAPSMPEHGIEIQRLHCTLNDKSHALTIATQRNADLVIWGESFCKIPEDPTLQRDPGGYNICPKGMLIPTPTPNPQLGEHITLHDMGELKLSATQDTRPQGISQWILSLYFYRNGEYNQAAQAAQHAQNSPTAGEWLAFGYQLTEGIAHLHAAAWPDAIQSFEHALQCNRETRNAHEGLSLILLGAAKHSRSQFYATPHPFRSILASPKPFDDTLPLLQEGLELRSRPEILGPDHPQLAIDHSYLGLAYMSLSQPMVALIHFNKARELIQKALGSDHPMLAKALAREAWALSELGRVKDAEDALKQALAISEKAHGSEHIEHARTLNDAGLTYRTNKQTAEAIAHLEKAYQIMKQAHKDQRNDWETTQRNLAITRAERSGWIPPERRTNDSSKRYGALIIECVKGECGGLQVGDWVQKYQGITVEDGRDLDSLMGVATPDRKITMMVVRNGKTLELKMKGEDLTLKTR